ncbi:hypothetical protein AVEN_90625-1 [Araneus ventricosus]|uniref:Uncharacterized protein n=1 Tax=Araneus ventricosus TaxID=182803 RepID=A0A4Y2NPS5_ARAVE|nr:hypothetical protein AVEN_90625-1 [Araneus ventricosus]
MPVVTVTRFSKFSSKKVKNWLTPHHRAQTTLVQALSYKPAEVVQALRMDTVRTQLERDDAYLGTSLSNRVRANSSWVQSLKNDVSVASSGAWARQAAFSVVEVESLTILKVDA